MGDIELPEEASAVQEIKKLRSKKLGGAQEKIERRMTKMKETGKQKTGDAESPGSEFEYVTERSDGYNFTHVIASTTIASLFRGVHTRMTLSRWKRMVGFLRRQIRRFIP